jgi:hypothetical protein
LKFDDRKLDFVQKYENVADEELLLDLLVWVESELKTGVEFIERQVILMPRQGAVRGRYGKSWLVTSRFCRT